MEALKWLREKKEESQSELGELMKVTKSTVGKWENGTHEPSFEILMKLADHYNVSIDYLIGYTNLTHKHPTVEDLLKEYLQRKFNKAYNDSEIETVDQILDLLEKYRE